MSKEAVLPLIEAGQQFDAIPRLRSITAADLLKMDIGPREMVLAPILPVKGLAMLYAPRGMGKTYVALSIALAVAGGGAVFGWKAPKPRRTLYVDGEMPAGVMQRRLAQLLAGAIHEVDPENLRFLSADLQERGMPDLSSPEGQRQLEEHLEGVEFVVIDNLSTLCRSGKENEAESWLAMQGWLLELRRRGISVLMIHHAGKNGQQRGTSRREMCWIQSSASKSRATTGPRRAPGSR